MYADWRSARRPCKACVEAVVVAVLSEVAETSMMGALQTGDGSLDVVAAGGWDGKFVGGSGGGGGAS